MIAAEKLFAGFSSGGAWVDEVQDFVSGLSFCVRVTHTLGMWQVLILGVKDNRTSEAVGHRRLQSVPFCLLHEA